MVKQFLMVTKASGVLCALLLGTAPVMGAAANRIGINPCGSLLDFNTDKPMADAMRSNRISYETKYAMDSSYWETTDGQYLVWAGLTTHNNNGTYRLYFNGKATVSASG